MRSVRLYSPQYSPFRYSSTQRPRAATWPIAPCNSRTSWSRTYTASPAVAYPNQLSLYPARSTSRSYVCPGAAPNSGYANSRGPYSPGNTAGTTSWPSPSGSHPRGYVAPPPHRSPTLLLARATPLSPAAPTPGRAPTRWCRFPSPRPTGGPAQSPAIAPAGQYHHPAGTSRSHGTHRYAVAQRHGPQHRVSVTAKGAVYACPPTVGSDPSSV